ncbi:hypothetical protein DMN91_006510 [Ooceraea biroi]|uniref:ubiquitinyl hydrolase 1 n=1 Tax=Ooceraea biroi TaxID=2015173 RepID=A0A3L8DNV5_OOCBI|nr:ubiquitin carboxyl-terminal hydrolase 8 isoform X1 [Ooceraea biroi]RLU22130.1 hypothetical protein DMN91_006510 [Ooceraea biroi]
MPNGANLGYTCLNDLVKQARVNYAGKEPRSVYQRLPTMRQKFEVAKRNGDDETAYIFSKRWLDTVEWLKKTQDYKDGKSISTNMTVDQINEVKNILADLRQKLEIRYEHSSRKHNDAVEKMEVDTDGVDAAKAYAPSGDISLKLPETPTDDPLYGDSDNFISCNQLYSLSQKNNSKYLIIDVRQKAHYDSSKMTFNKCINIPQSEIKPGKLGYKFANCFHKDKQSLDLFKHRSAQYVDVIILVDWNTTQETLTISTYLNILKDIFEKWDPGTKYKKIKILNGGYQEWLMTYPTFTTNSNVAVPEFNDVANEILDFIPIEYPDWLHSDEENEDSTKAQNKPSNAATAVKDVDMEMDHGDKKSAASKHARSNSNDVVSPAKTKNFTSHVTILIDGKQLPFRGDAANAQQFENPDAPAAQHKAPSQNEINAKPVIDRSSKPAALKTYDPRCKEVLRFMKELNELAKSKSKLAEELFNQEYALYSLRDDKYSASDEQYIRTDIKSLKGKLDEMHKMYLTVENEFNVYCKEADAIKFNPTDDNEKTNLEFNLSLLKKKIKDIESDRKKLQEELLVREYRERTKQNEVDVYKEPLRIDGSSINSGLERSYSSPNLLQLGDRKAPRVDRTSKPRISPRNKNGSIGNENVKVSPLSWGSREERMTPIHGSVHPGITGLKNLGNSCYMNSIIQCLSNTTNLAKYFTDDSYIDDLTNYDNTQGQVVEEVAQVIKALWRGQYKSISPHDLKGAVGQYKVQFETEEQQDSHEFLMFLLEWMHGELKKEMRIPTQASLSGAEKEWYKSMNYQKSMISDLFFGQLKSTITCLFCKQASITYETFNSLTMSLSQSNRCTLNECMDKFVSGQKVNGWKCPKCQTPRDAIKKFDFVKLAPIVVIHLNRFGENGGWFEKRNIAVDFPLVGFNLKPYLVSENRENTIPANNIRNYNYTLYAMSNHYGTMEAGHYTAFCKNATQNKWYKYDDQTVTEVSSSQVKSQNTSAYLLFYTSFPNKIM